MYRIDLIVLRVIFIWSLLQYVQSSDEGDLQARSSGNPNIGDDGKNTGNGRNPIFGDNGNNQRRKTRSTMTEEEVTSPITIVEARREMMGDQVKFTVKYKYDADGLTIAWTDGANVLDHSDNSLGDGTRETSAVTSLPERNWSLNVFGYVEDNTMAHTVGAAFFDSNGHGVRLGLVNAEGSDVQSDVSLPVLKVEPSEEFVYEYGSDFSFTITIPPQRREDEAMTFGSDPIHFQQYLLDLDTGEQKMYYSSSTFFERVDNKTYPEYQEWDMKLKTSEMKYSGVIMFSTFKVSQARRDLVKDIWHFASVNLHPTTQDGPFPSGYVDFFTQPWLTYEELDDGTKQYQLVCSRGTQRGRCEFSCLAAADELSDVNIYRVESDGTKTPVSDIPQYTKIDYPEFSEHLLQVHVTIPVSATTGKVSERFSCEARNTLGRTATTETVAYYHYSPPNIVETESEIQILNPNEGSMTLELKVVCKVEGYPRPKVTFSFYYWGSSYRNLPPDEINEEGNEITTAVKYLTYDKEDPYAFNGGRGRLSSASCTTEVGPPFGGYDYYSIPIPSEIKNS